LVPHNTARVAYDDGIVGDILRYDGICADTDIAADFDVTKEFGSGTDPDIITDLRNAVLFR
jgi:hypothetical protein